jgi:hypothetical protein
MHDTELLARWVDDLARDLRGLLEGLDDRDLAWRPDADAHGIGIIAWHIARWVDVLATLVVARADASQQHWFKDGWSARTGYDPRGKGAGGLGTLTDYNAEDVAGIPRLSASELAAYLDAVCADLRGGILSLPAGSLAPDARPYRQLANVLQGCWGHRGDIETLRSLALRART